MTGSQHIPSDRDGQNHSALRNTSVAGFVLLSLLVLVATIQHAWVSEDCFITFRYVSNTLSGHGAVFNLGERVQGFTHPLWYLALLPGCSVFHNAILVSVGYGLLLTVLTLIGLACALCRVAGRPLPALGAFALACAVLLSSDPWVSFQTSGLENALSHLLILLVIVEALSQGARRPGRLLLLLGLLCLTRPDFVFFSVPFVVWVVHRVGWRRAVRTAAISGAPAIAWVVFSWVYYGDPLPNTARAKLAIYPNWIEAAKQGSLYVLDWCACDSFAAVSSVVLLVWGIVLRRDAATLAVAAGVVLTVAWVIWIGGDFMRGRFLTPVLTASVVVGSMAFAERWGDGQRQIPPLVWVTCLCLLVVGVLSQTLGPAIPWRSGTDRWGIVNEREQYPGYSLRSYLASGRISNPYIDLTFARELRAYADAIGPVAVHYRNPGSIGYLAGPNVTVIDTLGLTDRTIAALPRACLTNPQPRPGHPDKYIPVRYLAARGDVSLLPGWIRRICRYDRFLRSEVRLYERSVEFWSPKGAIVTGEVAFGDKWREVCASGYDWVARDDPTKSKSEWP